MQKHDDRRVWACIVLVGDSIAVQVGIHLVILAVGVGLT